MVEVICAPVRTAHRHGALLAFQSAVDSGKVLLDGLMNSGDQHVRELCKRLAGLLGGERPRQDASSDQDHLLLAE